MKYRNYLMIFASALVFGAFPVTGSMKAAAQEMSPGGSQPQGMSQDGSEPQGVSQGGSQLQGMSQDGSQTQEMSPGWNQSQGRWYWMDEDGSLHKGWLQTGGRTYYMDENGIMVKGWKEVDGDWYYFHEDGGMNQGELVIGNALYECSKSGALESARWVDNTGGGAYNAGCYDKETQALFDDLNEEKKQLYFDAYPDREEGGSDMHHVYDRGAGFEMDMTLNKAADHRLEEAMEHGYGDSQVYGEGRVNDYLSTIPYRSHATCLELYIRNSQGEGDAFSKVEAKTQGRYDAGEDRKYSLEYYHSLGMAHRVRDGKDYFMIILMR